MEGGIRRGIKERETIGRETIERKTIEKKNSRRKLVLSDWSISGYSPFFFA